MSPVLVVIAWIALALAGLSMCAVIADLLLSTRQRMWIMNVVWPVTALWAGPIGLWAYVRFGRADRVRAPESASSGDHSIDRKQPFPVLVAKGTTHCGSGCTLGDMAAETFALVVPLTLFGQRLFGTWVYDFALAYLFGVAFQYFTIKPMRKESSGKALRDAVKADTLSLIAWQVGMFGWMALVRFVLFGRELPKSSPVFWFMMQIAMFLGFATAYPVNWWLLRRGVKEAM